jgi:hydrogenase maturation protease
VHGETDIKMSQRTSSDVLIVCIGNRLAGDDGLGEAVYERLREATGLISSQLLLLGLGGLTLLEYLRAQRLLIVVDAVQFGSQPGTVHVMGVEAMPSAGVQAVSLHGIGLRDTLCVAQALYPERVPERIVLIGVEGRCFNELGAPLSGEVEAALEAVVAEVNRQVIIASGRCVTDLICS